MIHGGPGCSCREETEDSNQPGYWLTSYADPQSQLHYFQHIKSVESFNASNDSNPSSPCLRLFRDYQSRLLSTEEILVRPTDPEEDPLEIVIALTFQSPSRLILISLISEGFNKIQLFSNVHDLGISGTLPTQEIEIPVDDLCGSIQIPLRTAKFININSLTMKLIGDSRSENCCISWIGLKGVSSGIKRQAVETVYESKPNLADHQIKETQISKNWDIS
jgi:PITH domain